MDVYIGAHRLLFMSLILRSMIIDIIATMEEVPSQLDDLIVVMPLAERVPVVALNALLKQRDVIEEEQLVQMQKINKTYSDRIRPLLERASQLIQGQDPRPQEVAALSGYLKPGEKVGAIKGKVIDRYWNAALENSSVANLITEADEKALEYLQDIQIVDDKENEGGLTLRFLFKQNPYFTETVLVRKLRNAKGSPICIEGDLPSWKTGHWLTHESKKANNKNTGLSKVVQGKKIDSFFDIFINWNAKENPEELQKCFTIINELSNVIRDSLNYFLGVFEVDDDSLDEEDDEEDEEEEDESEEPPAKTKK